MDTTQNKAAMEAMLFACGEPVTAARLAEAISIQTYMAEEILQELQKDYLRSERGIQLVQVADAWQLTTKNEYAQPVKTVLDQRKNIPLSPAAMEVLAIIAYNQPVSRGFVEQVRGVDSSSIVARLLERGLIEEAGRLELPGHPISFRTTDVFLRTFGIQNLSELPDLHEDEAEPPAPESTPEENE